MHKSGWRSLSALRKACWALEGVRGTGVRGNRGKEREAGGNGDGGQGAKMRMLRRSEC